MSKTNWTAVDLYGRSEGHGSADSPEAALLAALNKLQDTCGRIIGTHGIYLSPPIAAGIDKIEVITDHKNGQLYTQIKDPAIRQRLRDWQHAEQVRRWEQEKE